MSAIKAMGTGREKIGCGRMNFHLGRQRKQRLVSFTGSISTGTVRPEPGEAPGTVSAGSSGPACPERGLGEGWSAGLLEDSKLLAMLPLSWLL